MSENEENKEQEENKDSEDEDYHPMIVGTEDKEIMEKKPPNDKILQYNILEKKSEEEKAKETSNEKETAVEPNKSGETQG